MSLISTFKLSNPQEMFKAQMKILNKRVKGNKPNSDIFFMGQGNPDREKSFNLSPRDLGPSPLDAGQVWHLDLCVTLGV